MASPSPPVRPSLVTPEVSTINTEWTLRLRFCSLFGQLCTVAVVEFVMHLALPLGPLLTLIALGLFSNLVALLHLRRHARSPAWLLPTLMGLDVLHLTAMLYLTGGPMNPFSFMYLVLIALGTVVLPPRVTWGLVALSVAGSAVLFLWHRPLTFHQHGEGAVDPMGTHLYGMWVAFSVAAAFIVYFLLRIRRALAQREEELEAARSLAARRDKLASLGTLAAGAAHELATPLGTIAIAAKELERQLASGPPDPRAMEDVLLIRSQVARCRAVLDQLGREAGDSHGESLRLTSIESLLEGAQDGLAAASRLRFERDPELALLMLRLPARALAQALRALLKNALESTPAPSLVTVQLQRQSQLLHIVVRDSGGGMSAGVLRRLGEPFFTTKPPGSGMGLGVFLCRAVLESLGGQLLFASQENHGTVATMVIPLDGELALLGGQGAAARRPVAVRS